MKRIGNKKKPTAKALTLRVPEQLWRAASYKLVNDKLSFQELLTFYLERYVAGDPSIYAKDELMR